MVGFGRPPTKHQYKPGQSGNPRGRKAGSKNIGTLLQEGLDKRLTIKGSGKTLTAREAIAQQLLVNAVKGDLKSIAYLMGLIEKSPPTPRQYEKITKDMSQQQAADVYMRLLRAGQGSD
jgi:hypothetical protein